MEYNLVHAMLGRFGVLIPLLGLFFEIATIVTQKKLVFKIAGAIIILGATIAVFAGITGFLEYRYLITEHEDITPFRFHMITGSMLSLVFAIIIAMRVLLFKNQNEKLFIAYILIYVITIMANLLSNEFIIHAVRETGI